MTKVYDLLDKIKESKQQSSNPVNYFNNYILNDCPFERQYLFPGKFYIFKYKPQTKNIYDSKPYIMSLGFEQNHPNLIYGINMHHMPYKIRVQFFDYVYNFFRSILEKEIYNYPNPGDAVFQKYITEITADNMLNVPFNIKPSINKYDMQYMSNCRLINYNLLHYIIQSDEDYFVNGTISDAQKKFLKHTLRTK